MFSEISACLLVTFWLVQGTQAVGKNWAILVASSKGWRNYRHQADMCHVYHLLRNNGMDPDNIITFMYDDIAYHKKNPFRGQIFNSYRHTDVYYNVIIDYRGKDVTPKMFLKVMRGDIALKKKGKKVLDSGPNDNVFLFMADHGSPGVICFPKKDNNNKYSKMVVSVEACYSGSMFAGILTQDLNVYAMTAANPIQPSWAVLCWDVSISTCLSNEYTFNWISYIEKKTPKSIDWDITYQAVEVATLYSDVMKYGDMKIAKDIVSDYIGYRAIAALASTPTAKPTHFVNATDVHVHVLRREVEQAKSAREKALAQQHLSRAVKLDQLAKLTMDLIVDEVKSTVITPKNVTAIEALTCVEKSYNSFKRHCFAIQKVPSVATELVKIHKLCKTGISANLIISAINKTCRYD